MNFSLRPIGLALGENRRGRQRAQLGNKHKWNLFSLAAFDTIGSRKPTVSHRQRGELVTPDASLRELSFKTTPSNSNKRVSHQDGTDNSL